ncbi:hypothetical protein CIK90_05750 [Prevotella sp. P5-126]|nr:hypothetical protein CIK90_05750 [Prevotella sp. P5-126]
MTFSMMLNDVDDYAISMSLVSKFIEFAEPHDAYRYLIFYIPIGYTISKKSLKNRVSGRYATHCLLKQLSATAEK